MTKADLEALAGKIDYMELVRLAMTAHRPDWNKESMRERILRGMATKMARQRIERERPRMVQRIEAGEDTP